MRLGHNSNSIFFYQGFHVGKYRADILSILV
jgi:hypothetical protein